MDYRGGQEGKALTWDRAFPFLAGGSEDVAVTSAGMTSATLGSGTSSESDSRRSRPPVGAQELEAKSSQCRGKAARGSSVGVREAGQSSAEH